MELRKGIRIFNYRKKHEQTTSRSCCPTQFGQQPSPTIPAMPSVLEVGRDEQSPNAKTLGYLLCWQVSWQVSDDDQLQEPGEKPNKTYGFFNIGCLRICLYIPWNANPSRVHWNVYIQKLWLCCPRNPDRTWQPGHLSSVGRWPSCCWDAPCLIILHEGDQRMRDEENCGVTIEIHVIIPVKSSDN